MKFDIQFIITIILTVLVVITIFVLAPNITSPIGAISIPSEEYCSIFNTGWKSDGFLPYYALEPIGGTEQYVPVWCEQNETGWHFNRTYPPEDSLK